MPMFEFDCRSCGHQFETLVMSGRATPRCPKCEGTELEKRFSVFGTGGSRSTGAGFSVPAGGG